eukprot:7382110-Prymnesium_polylepis.1
MASESQSVSDSEGSLAGENQPTRSSHELIAVICDDSLGKAERAEAVRRLLSEGVPANGLDNLPHQSPLYHACDKGRAEVVQMLLAANSSLAADRTSGWTAYHLAVRGGSAEVVQQLLAIPEAASSIDTRDHSGETALHWACFFNRGHLLRLLLHAGADFKLPFAAARLSRLWTDKAKEIFCQREPLHWAYDNPEYFREPASANYGRAVLQRIGIQQELMEAEQAKSRQGQGSAQVLLDEVGWSPSSHRCFHPAARARAVELMMLGHLLAKSLGSAAVLDVWRANVIPRAMHGLHACTVPTAVAGEDSVTAPKAVK